MNPLRVIAFFVVLATIAKAQPPVSFEVASVRVSVGKPGPGFPLRGQISGGPGTSDPEHITYEYCGMELILRHVFGVPPEPDSVDRLGDERYDIRVLVPPGTTIELASEMMKALLRERFNLAYRIVKKSREVYELVVTKGGAKLRDAEGAAAPPPASLPAGSDLLRSVLDKEGFPILRPGVKSMLADKRDGVTRVTFRSSDTNYILFDPQFVLRSTEQFIDKTGLTGKYDFELKYSSKGPDGALQGAAPDLETALQQQLGLKL
jgi:uncharacterized protein (TIGR03435 family)